MQWQSPPLVSFCEASLCPRMRPTVGVAVRLIENSLEEELHYPLSIPKLTIGQVDGAFAFS
jgi:hypothetical protein